MKLERDDENNIIIRDENNQERHPYVTVLAAIEFQQKIIPPRVPELTTQGWDMIVSALKECIDNFGNPYKIVDTQVEIKEDGTVAEIISVQPVDTPVLKTEEVTQPVDENNPPSMTAPAIAANKKPVPKR